MIQLRVISRYVTTLIFCLLCNIVKVSGKGIEGDSLTREREIPRYLLPTIGGGLVMAGSLLDFDHGGRTQGMDFKHSFSYKADEVLRFVPAAALVGMKAFGIESRTEKWSELIVRSAASTAIMGLTVESTKRLVGRVRPDGSDDRSFPSGHTAAAFLTASLFAKEYGHLSPWYSVGAYGVATSTAMLRRINDKHWMSDVMVGAGIGILSVELGYALADIFYKERQWENLPFDENNEKRTFGGIYTSCILPHALTGRTDGRNVRSRMGYSAGMEVSHFFTPNIGVNGRMGITSSQMEVKTGTEDYRVCDEPLDHVTVAIGPCLSVPIGKGFDAGIRLAGGYGLYPQATLAGIQIEAAKGWGCEGGISVGYTTRKRVHLGLTANYQSWEAPTDWMDNKGYSIGLVVGF